MLIRTSLALTAAVVAAPASSAEATLKIRLPRLDLAEYHKPYVAAWIEKASDQSFAGNVALWYDLGKRNDGGARWLKDMRSWWRKSGRDGAAIDGITGATRGAGEHAIDLLDTRAVVALPPGRYEMVVEAARENGGREVLRVPFEWPLKTAQSAQARGQGELGSVAIDARP